MYASFRFATAAALLALSVAPPAVGAAAARAAPSTPIAAPAAADTMVVAGGCFWGVESVFEHVAGVTSVVSGFADGAPRTSYAEAVRVVFDPARVSYAQLLDVFFAVAHDPTQRDRQGPDVGRQYRSALFFTAPAQRAVADSVLAALRTRRTFRQPIVTQFGDLAYFREAPAEHQDYVARNPATPYVVINDLPKLELLRRTRPGLYRAPAG